MNHFGDGGGRNDHTLLIRGDMLLIYTVDAPYNNRLHPLRAVVATAMVALVRICYFIVHSYKKVLRKIGKSSVKFSYRSVPDEDSTYPVGLYPVLHPM